MSVMITTTPTSDGVVVCIAGRLEAADLPVLTSALDRQPAAVEIELSQLPAADDEAIAFLGRCRASGMILSGASPYVSLLLDAAGEDPALPDVGAAVRR